MTDRTTAAHVYGETVLWELPIQRMAADFIRPGDTVFDVGGNVGGLTVAFSRLVGPEGRVVAFECNPPIVQVFRETMRVNGVANAELIEKAAFERSGETLTFNADPSFYAAASSLFNKVAGADEISVSTIALDDVPGPRPSFIKLDVEGAEHAVLRGARRLLDEAQPAIILEYFHANEAATDPLRLLAEHGYGFYDVNLYRPVDSDFYLGGGANANVLAIPPRLRGERRYERVAVGRADGSSTSRSRAIRSCPCGCRSTTNPGR